MSKRLKKPKQVLNAAGPRAAAWDAEFSPLHLLFHHDDPARGERLLIVDDDGRRIAPETPEAFAQYMAFQYSADCDHTLLGQNGVGPAVKIRLRWPDALAFLRRCDWKTRPVENRVQIGFHGAQPPKWAVDGWKALDAGLIRPNALSWDPPSGAEIADFFDERTPRLSEVAAVVLSQYQDDIARLGKANPPTAKQLKRDLDLWTMPALVSLPAVQEQPGRLFKINGLKVLKRAYELMAYDYSGVDPIEVETLCGLPLEVYTDRVEFEKATGETL